METQLQAQCVCKNNVFYANVCLPRTSCVLLASRWDIKMYQHAHNALFVFVCVCARTMCDPRVFRLSAVVSEFFFSFLAI